MCDRKFPGKAPGLLLKKILERIKNKLIGSDLQILAFIFISSVEA